MIKKVFLAVLLTITFCIPIVNAQDLLLSEANTSKDVPKEVGQKITLTTSNRIRTPNKYALAVQVAYNVFNYGAGIRYSYDITEIVRLSFDLNYYFRYSWSDVEEGWGLRKLDLNANVNFIIGEGNVHFYPIVGVYSSLGNALLFPEIVENGDKVKNGFGINIGCGGEFQIANSFRLFLEQQASLGLMSSWMPKLGCALCF